MRTKTIIAGLCLVGAVAVGCADGGGDAADAADRAEAAGPADTRTPDQLLSQADRTMKALTSVTVAWEATSGSTGNRSTSRLTTDLKSSCSLKATASYAVGVSEMRQIRIGETDYIHPNDVYLEMWGRGSGPTDSFP